MTPTPLDITQLLGAGAGGSAAAAVESRISHVAAVLSVSPDPFAQPPHHTLDRLISTEVDSER
jgi:hypothetical protein